MSLQMSPMALIGCLVNFRPAVPIYMNRGVPGASAHMTQVLPQVSCCALCGVIEDPLPEQIQLHPSIATPLDQLQTVDVAFDRSA